MRHAARFSYETASVIGKKKVSFLDITKLCFGRRFRMLASALWLVQVQQLAIIVLAIEDDASRDFEEHSVLSQGGPVGFDPSGSVTTSVELPDTMANEEASPGGADLEMPVETLSISEMLAETESTAAAVPPSSSDSVEPGRHEIDDISNGAATIDVAHHSIAEPSPAERPGNLLVACVAKITCSYCRAS